MNLLALSGKAGSGKNTIVSHLEHKEICFADSLRLLIKHQFIPSNSGIWPRDMKSRDSDTLKEQHAKEYVLPCKKTVREVLQVLGCAYRDIDEYYWVDKWQARYTDYRKDNPTGLVVVTDVRFVNEVEAVEALGGTVVRLTRDTLRGFNKSHQSETELDGYDFEHTLDNKDMTIKESKLELDKLIERIG